MKNTTTNLAPFHAALLSLLLIFQSACWTPGNAAPISNKGSSTVRKKIDQQIEKSVEKLSGLVGSIEKHKGKNEAIADLIERFDKQLPAGGVVAIAIRDMNEDINYSVQGDLGMYMIIGKHLHEEKFPIKERAGKTFRFPVKSSEFPEQKLTADWAYIKVNDTVYRIELYRLDEHQ